LRAATSRRGQRRFTLAKNTKERSYAATIKDVGQLMRLFEQTIDALRSQRVGIAIEMWRTRNQGHFPTHNW
jgi:hypothetical protein